MNMPAFTFVQPLLCILQQESQLDSYRELLVTTTTAQKSQKEHCSLVGNDVRPRDLNKALHDSKHAHNQGLQGGQMSACTQGAPA